MKSNDKNQGGILKKFFLTIIFGLPLAALIAYLVSFSSRILPHIYVCEYDLGGKTKIKAKEFLTLAIKDKLFSEITLELEEPQKEKWKINLKDFDYAINIDESVKTAYSVGRTPNLFTNLKKRITLWREKEVLPFQYDLDFTKLEEKVATISGEIYVPAVNPQLIIIKSSSGQKRIEIEPGKNGLETDQRLLFEKIFENLACLKPLSLKIPVLAIQPQLSEEEKTKAKQQAENLLDKTLKINFEDQAWEINDENLLSFMEIRGGFNEEKVNQYIDNLKGMIERNPENATFKMEEGEAVVFHPAKEGILLDRKKTKEDFLSLIKRLEENPDLRQESLQVTVSRIPPKIKNEDVNSLGIKELISLGKSRFKGSISERIHNISLAAEKLNGQVVGPGEIFSFNQALGEVSEATGFKKAYIIKGGRTILGDGGGVCQVSTTLFRAVLNAGLPVEERHAHAYRVSYYEQDSQPGFDATVFDPTADLKFKNDTPAHILIQSDVSLGTKTLIFKLYGTSDGRSISLGKAYIWDIVPPPPDLYQDDLTLPAGTIKQVDWKAWGSKVRFTWKVTRGEEILQEKTFYSQYRPWQAVYLRGIANR